jgi:hypothetical protein
MHDPSPLTQPEYEAVKELLRVFRMFEPKEPAGIRAAKVVRDMLRRRKPDPYASEAEREVGILEKLDLLGHQIEGLETLCQNLYDAIEEK